MLDPRTSDGEQVRSELDSPERTVDTGGEGPGQQGLADAGDVLDQDVPFGQQGDDGEPDHLGLAEDHESDVFDQRFERESSSSREGVAVSVIWVTFMRYAQRVVVPTGSLVHLESYYKPCSGRFQR